VAQALDGADLVQENGPERIDFKQKLYGTRRVAAPRCDHRSSSSGLTMSEIQRTTSHPERCVIGHTFNPPHLIRWSEIVAERRLGSDDPARG